MRIFVGNLSFDAKEPDVKKVFESFGAVSSVVIKMKEHKAKSRGFGFVEMSDASQAQAAIAALNGKELMGRPLKVDPARVETDADRKKPERINVHPQGRNREEGYQHRKARSKKPWHGSKPWEKRSGGESKPWHSSKPREKHSGGESKPWQKREGESKQRSKRGAGDKPWEKPHQRSHGAWKNKKSRPHIKNRPSK